MRFKATEDQVKEMGALAVSASSAVGMGHLHFNGEQKFEAKDFKTPLFTDYVQGRMVKLNIQKDEEDGVWWSNDFPPRSDYQSWASKYPDTKLIETVGATVLN